MQRKELENLESKFKQARVELNAAISKLKIRRNQDGSHMKDENGKIIIDPPENEEEQRNLDHYYRAHSKCVKMEKQIIEDRSLLSALSAQEAQRQIAIAESGARKGAVLGVINQVWTHGFHPWNFVSGAGLGALHGGLLGTAVSKLGFWGKRCAAIGATVIPLRNGLAFDLKALEGAEVGMLIGALIDALENNNLGGPCARLGLKIGLIGGMCAFGLELSSVLLAGYWLTLLGGAVDYNRKEIEESVGELIDRCRKR